MNTASKIFVAGHNGMVGSAICRALDARGYENVIRRSRADLDLLNQQAVLDFFETEKPDVVVLAAAKVGGINANNTYRANFLFENLMIEANVVHAAWIVGVQNLLFLGSSCIYPRDCLQPIKEEYLLTGPLEKTNEPYAIAKIAGLKLCEAYNSQYKTNYISLMPSNLYGPGDNYDLANSHVLPALIRKTHEASMRGDRNVVVWGDGSPLREFLFVDDLADAVVFLMERKPSADIFNVGFGSDISIGDLAKLVVSTLGFNLEIVFDTSKPNGTPRKLIDSSRINQMGWVPKVGLEEGIEIAYGDFLRRQPQ
jgi:GDP-L-fucose synthase